MLVSACCSARSTTPITSGSALTFLLASLGSGGDARLPPQPRRRDRCAARAPSRPSPGQDARFLMSGRQSEPCGHGSTWRPRPGARREPARLRWTPGPMPGLAAACARRAAAAACTSRGYEIETRYPVQPVSVPGPCCTPRSDCLVYPRHRLPPRRSAPATPRSDDAGGEAGARRGGFRGPEGLSPWRPAAAHRLEGARAWRRAAGETVRGHRRRRPRSSTSRSRARRRARGAARRWWPAGSWTRMPRASPSACRLPGIFMPAGTRRAAAVAAASRRWRSLRGARSATMS
jgi:hypothetical protein